jgi:protein subunit release factor B
MIREEDIIERFTRSSGPGGQNVNKVSTCVCLKHLPTGIEVRCSSERSQAQNRLIARRLLREKVDHFYHSQKLENIDLQEKLRRQNRLKPMALREKILREKHLRAKIKISRRKNTAQEEE